MPYMYMYVVPWCNFPNLCIIRNKVTDMHTPNPAGWMLTFSDWPMRWMSTMRRSAMVTTCLNLWWTYWHRTRTKGHKVFYWWSMLFHCGNSSTCSIAHRPEKLTHDLQSKLCHVRTKLILGLSYAICNSSILFCALISVCCPPFIFSL